MAVTRSIKLGRKGQMVLPKEIRDRLGLKEGDYLVVSLQGGEILLATPERYAKRTRGMLKGTWGRTKEEIERYLKGERESWEGVRG